MDVAFNISSFLNDRISIFNAQSLQKLNRDGAEKLKFIIDTLGEKSAKAQGLPKPITTWQKLFSSSHSLYICSDCNKRQILGLIKVGVKKLFIRDSQGLNREIDPLCVLDFYVHETMQRTGVGSLLFEAMLKHEKARPDRLGYDRPSHKFLSFLKKHYNLSFYIPQMNNFVVFERYFDPNAAIPQRNVPLEPMPKKSARSSPTAETNSSVVEMPPIRTSTSRRNVSSLNETTLKKKASSESLEKLSSSHSSSSTSIKDASFPSFKNEKERKIVSIQSHPNLDVYSALPAINSTGYRSTLGQSSVLPPWGLTTSRQKKFVSTSHEAYCMDDATLHDVELAARRGAATSLPPAAATKAQASSSVVFGSQEPSSSLGYLKHSGVPVGGGSSANYRENLYNKHYRSNILS
eukprot:GCRY01001653.1.p1 GENE.GCRY01001653.1~~GCRY01001653.1.p1  ORF type:complete len:406 (+),score=61.22 GCRY01001653.1:227-1444(+)